MSVRSGHRGLRAVTAGYPLQGAMAFRGSGFHSSLPCVLRWFPFLQLCSPTYWISGSKSVKLMLLKEHFDTNVKHARTAFG